MTTLPQPGALVYLRIGETNVKGSVLFPSVSEKNFTFRLEDGVEISAEAVDAWCYIPGGVIGVDKEHIYVATADSWVAIQEIQVPGKKRMPVADFLRGNKVKPGDFFGPQ